MLFRALLNASIVRFFLFFFFTACVERSIEGRMKNHQPRPASPPVSHAHHAEVKSPYSVEPEATEADLYTSSFLGGDGDIVGGYVGRKGGWGGGEGEGEGPRASVVHDADADGTALWPDPIACSSGDEADDEITSAANTMEELDPIATAKAYGFSAAAIGEEWGVFGGVSGGPASTAASTGNACMPGFGRDVKGDFGGGTGRFNASPPHASGIDIMAEGGDIDGGNVVDSVAEVVETYLLVGSDEEGYQEMEDALAAGHWLDDTDAMLGETYPNPRVVG